MSSNCNPQPRLHLCASSVTLSVTSTPPPKQMIQILCPGQRSVPARPDRPIPLGAALCIADLADVPESFDLVGLAESNPWAVVACVAPEQGGILSAWRRHTALRRMTTLNCTEPQWEEGLRAELASFGPPEPSEIVAYIAERCADPTLERALLAELAGHSRPGRSARHSAFKRRGRSTAKGWKGLYTIVRALCLPGQPRLLDAAALLGIDPRTLRRHCHHVLELDWRDARRGIGWKWAVERALRLHGYLPDQPPLPLAFHHLFVPPPPARKGVGS